MWWDDEDSQVSEHIRRLLEAWRDGALPFVTAIGSTWTHEDERTLFVGVDPRLDPRPMAWAEDKALSGQLAQWLIRRYGPLPFPEPEVYRAPTPGGESAPVAVARPPRLLRVVVRLVAYHTRLYRQDDGLLTIPIDRADPQTRAMQERYNLPPVTRIGYISGVKPLARKGESTFRRRAKKPRATVGCLVLTERGMFLTTAGHLGVRSGDSVYRRVRRRLFLRWSTWGHVTAVTSPEDPDTGSGMATGLDLAVFAGYPPISAKWRPVKLGEPRELKRDEYVQWNGGVTGRHEGRLAYTAAAVKAMDMDEDQLPYEHALMVTGYPPRLAGRQGDSGSAVYDAEGRLLGHIVGLEGSMQGGTAPSAWFQMIDIAHEYLERHCGQVLDYWGDCGRS